MKYLFVIVGLLVLIVACTQQSQKFVLQNDSCNASDSCYFDLTQKNHTVACSLIKDHRLQSLCYVEAVKFDPKEEYCSLTSSEDSRYCYAELGIALKEYSACDKSVDLSKEYCIASIAMDSGDLASCSKLESPQWREPCISFFGMKNKDKSLCFSINTNNILRDRCVYNISVDTNDVALCDSVVNTDAGTIFEKLPTTFGCVATVSKNTANVSSCAVLTDSLQRDTCKLRVIKSINDSSLCLQIGTLIVRKSCIDGFAKILNQTTNLSQSNVSRVNVTT